MATATKALATEDGQAAQSIKLQAIADAILTLGGDGNVTNPNQLINPWFTVNQREFSSGSNAGYTADRWKKADNSGTLTLTSLGMQFPASTACELNYIFESRPWEGKTITISLMYSDGNIVSATDIWSTGSGNKSFIDDGKMTVDINSSGNLVIKHSTADASARTVRALKLEIGSISTLHLDAEPDISIEFLKCQRYFYRINHAAAFKTLGIGVCVATTYARTEITLSVPMRTTPTLSYVGTWYLYLSYSNPEFSSIALSANDSDLRHIAVYGTNSSITAGTIGFFNNKTQNAYIDFSAEL